MRAYAIIDLIRNHRSESIDRQTGLKRLDSMTQINPQPAFGTLLPSLGEGLGMRVDDSLRYEAKKQVNRSNHRRQQDRLRIAVSVRKPSQQNARPTERLRSPMSPPKNYD